MTPDEVTEQRLAKAFAPALFAESLEAWVAAEELVRDLPTEHPRRVAVIWRALELRTPFDPAGVLAEIDNNPPPADDEGRWQRVPIVAMISCGELDRAESELIAGALHTEPAWDVLRGQLALARGDAAAAERHLARARAGATEVEDRAMALLWSLEVAARTRDGERLAGYAGELDAVLAGVGAATSQQMVALKALVSMLGAEGLILGQVYSGYAEEAKQQLCKDVPEEQAQLGPIPRHVHGAFRKLRGDPRRLEAELLNVAGLQYRGGQRGEAYATLSYAARLAPRLMPADAADRLREAFARFREVIGPDQVAEQEAYLKMREETFLRTMRGS